jgi:hypothetical protein
MANGRRGAAARARFMIWLSLGTSAALGQQLASVVATAEPATPNDSVSGVMPSTSPGQIELRDMTLRVPGQTGWY